MSWNIAISNQKGGVGKTTTCMSLGACLAELGYRTLIVDMDSQSNLTMSAKIDPDNLELAIPDLLESDEENNPDPSSIIQPTPFENLYILPSDLRLAATEQALYEKPEYEKALKDIIEPLESEYSFILIDCPPSLGTLTLASLTAAHIVLVPVQCEYYSARGLLRLLDVIKAVQQHTNADLDYYLVITMFDKRNRITLRVYDQLQENLKDKFFDTIVGIDTKLRESAVVGEPIITYSPHSRGSKNYRQLAQEIINTLNIKGPNHEER